LLIYPLYWRGTIPLEETLAAFDKLGRRRQATQRSCRTGVLAHTTAWLAPRRQRQPQPPRPRARARGAIKVGVSISTSTTWKSSSILRRRGCRNRAGALQSRRPRRRIRPAAVPAPRAADHGLFADRAGPGAAPPRAPGGGVATPLRDPAGEQAGAAGRARRSAHFAGPRRSRPRLPAACTQAAARDALNCRWRQGCVLGAALALFPAHCDRRSARPAFPTA
jgi:hypothetical protein